MYYGLQPEIKLSYVILSYLILSYNMHRLANRKNQRKTACFQR